MRESLDETLARQTAELFPEAVLGPWRERVAREAPGWKAGMRPYAGNGFAMLTLRRGDVDGIVAHHVEMTAWTDRGDAMSELIAAALAYERTSQVFKPLAEGE